MCFVFMKILLFFIGYSLLWFCGTPVVAQSYEVCPAVPDFMDLEQPWVTSTYGTVYDPFENIGVMPGRHTLITEPGTDFITRNQLNLLPEGVDRVIRLGNSNIGGEAESITYRFIADIDRPLLLLHFAVVFEDPDHSAADQPRFAVQVLNHNGKLVEDCAEYDVCAGEGLEGFHELGGSSDSKILWRDWTTVGIDLSAYGGEEIQVRFLTYDCALSAHFGYAYFYASCVSSRLSVHACKGDGFELKAPDYFASYLWSNAETTQVSHWPTGFAGNISCELTSVTGCRLTVFSTPAKEDRLPARDTLIHDTICEGESYRKNGFDLPAQKTSGTYSNVLFDVSDCHAVREVNVALALNVVQKYMFLEEYICEGEDYVKNGFCIRKPAVGEYMDTVEISVSGRCGSYRVLNLQVSSAVMQPRIIVGDQNPCGGDITEYRVSQVERGDRYQWEGPEGITVKGKTLPTASLRFPLEEKKDSVKLRIINGCGSYQTALPIHVFPSYRILYEDTICSGLTYRKHGFLFPPQEKSGPYVKIIYDKTKKGCDSVAILQLEVFGTPKVSIDLNDSVFCTPQEITLKAKIEGVKVKKDIGIGDIVCKDGSVVSMEEYEADGKEAKAIVFWVDQTGQHGWAVDVWEPADPLVWGRNPYLPLKKYRMVSEALGDYEGRKNTDVVLEDGIDKYPAFKAIVHGDEWYMPAAGQWDILFASYVLINKILQEVGGQPIDLSSECTYYSSTMAGSDYWIWFIQTGSRYGGTWMDHSMVFPRRVRGICDF